MNLVYLKQTIEKAIIDHKYIVVDYVGTKGKITTNRILEPLKLSTDKRNFEDVVEAHCFLRNEWRSFQLAGIQKIKVIDPTEAASFKTEESIDD